MKKFRNKNRLIAAITIFSLIFVVFFSVVEAREYIQTKNFHLTDILFLTRRESLGFLHPGDESGADLL